MSMRTLAGRCGTAGNNRPFGSSTVVVAVDADAFEEGRDRRLHAKAFEVLCSKGRLLVSGSANATSAALSGRNVEACVARIQRDVAVGWLWIPGRRYRIATVRWQGCR